MADNMRPISVAFGKVNLKRASGTLASWKLEAPFKRTTAVGTGKSDAGGKTYSQATPHPTIGGGFTTAQVRHPEGTIIMLQASRTRNGMRVADACFCLRLRENAAFRLVKVKIPHDRESLLGDTFVAFTGNADLLTLADLKALGIDIPKQWVSNFFAPDEVEELFEHEVIRLETTPPPSYVRVTTTEGTEVKAMAAERIRRVRVRR